MILTLSNRFKHEKGIAGIDFSSHTFKLAIMAAGFTFDPDTHGTWADVSASELAGGSGYTAGGETLTVSSAWAQDNVNDRASISWNNLTVTANGGDIGPFQRAIIYDDTHADNVILGCVDIETQVTILDGDNYRFEDLGYNFS